MSYLRRVVVSGCVVAGLVAAFSFHNRTAKARARSITATSPTPLFPAGSVWTRDSSSAPADPASDAIIQWLDKAGGWGTGKVRVDFAIRVLQTDVSTPKVPFRKAKDFYDDASNDVPYVPLPSGGGMEGQSGYQCPVGQEDCHYIVVDRSSQKLYEAWSANYDGRAITAVMLAIWDLNRVYPPSGRGDQCTSADAAGYSIAALLFNADELAVGHIDHAIRFVLPNERIRAGVFIHPATHAGGPAGPALAPPYGTHLRLKSTYNLSQLKPAAQVVARAMQKYGMFLADGGNVALTAQNDADTKTKYSDVGFESNDLGALKVTDFEVLKEGPLIPLTRDCVLNR